MRNKKNVEIASRIEYIDPACCDSTVGFTIIKGRRGMRGNVDLTDCNRKIQWYFSNDIDSVRKIDKAISILQSFRTTFVGARKKKKTSGLTRDRLSCILTK